jgi:hypothetical protein
MEPNVDALLSLVKTYARYFVKDHTGQVMGHIASSYPMDTDSIDTVVSQTVGDRLNVSTLQALQATPTSRFLYECAKHALESDCEDPASYETWQQVSSLPSVHHDDIAEQAYGAAVLYKQTLETTLVQVIGKDAETAAQTILQKAQNRITSEETGGTIATFTWGILADGMWLNAALARAFDVAKIFRPGDPVLAYFAETAVKFARVTAPVLTVDMDRRTELASEFAILMSHSTFDTPQTEDDTDVSDLLFIPGVLTSAIERWRRGYTNGRLMVDAVTDLTTLVYRIQALQDAYRQHDLVDTVSDQLIQRLDDVYQTITLMLVGFEAVRETSFANSLIFYVDGQGADPVVTTYVNADQVTGYIALGGTLDDCVSFGQYYDPRKSISPPAFGWTVSFLIATRDKVIPEVLAQSAERLESRRKNDVSVIQEIVSSTLTAVVRAYLAAKDMETIPYPVSQTIAALAKSVSVSTQSVDMEKEIVKLLVQTLGDDTVQSVSECFFLHEDHPQAPACTIATMTARDAVEEIVAA